MTETPTFDRPLPPPPPPVWTTPPPPRRGRFAAMVLAGALVLGGGAGVGGAAAYDALSGDDGGSGGGATATRPLSQVASNGDSSPAADGSVEQVAADVLPSVVKLDVEGQEGAGSGSGVVLTADGEILTNDHVASLAGDGGSITVSFDDGTEAPAEVIGTDPLTDTALIKAQGVDGLTPATLGKSSDVAVGEQVVAIGSPFGLDATVTSGIVSALNRPVDVGSDEDGNTTAYPAIQTDAAINPGNSGGPLVDLDGHVIGLNASIRSTSSSSEAGSIGLGFAIPIDEILPVVEQMRAGETPTHARIGVSVSDDDAGALVSEVSNGSAADDAGLRQGDVITKVDDTEIETGDGLVATVRAYRPGDQVTLTYLRDGDERTTDLTLGSDAA